MYALDFLYDGKYLSDYGFMICDFSGQNGAETMSAGSQITFEKVRKNNGYKYSIASAQYNECIQAEFDICKDPETNDSLEITNDEFRDLMRWLNRKQFLKFFIISEDKNAPETCYYNASFTVRKICIGDILYGLKLNMETDSPFGHSKEKDSTINVLDISKPYVLDDVSDEIGDTYIDMQITCNSSGNLTIKNTTNNTIMSIANCVNSEVITIDGNSKIISSSIPSHKIQNDFNYEFMKISNSIDSTKNQFTFSLPCTAIIKYTPIIKDTPR